MQPVSTYETFEIHIESHSKKGNLLLRIRCPAGETSIALDNRLIEWAHDPSRQLMGTHFGTQRDLVRIRDDGRDEPNRTPEDIGGELYKAVFRGEVASLLKQSLDDLSHQPQCGLCIRLHFDLEDRQQAQLACLPWEVLFHTEQKSFLAHDTQTPIIRFLEVPGRTPLYELPPRLKILVVISRPRGLQALMAELESDRIRTSWRQDNVQVTLLQRDEQGHGEKQDLGSLLRDQLRRGEFHVLHFIGHGTFDSQTQVGSIFFETADRQPLQVSGQSFANWLINHPSLRLVVLNACSTGQLPGTEPFAGVAPALVRAGIPGALAMQQPMADKMALEFSRVLYQGLADGIPVEAALSKARLKLFASPGDSAAWATPVLFQRTPDLIRIPPRIGPALARFWTLVGASHLIFVGLLFLRSRSVPVPVLYDLMNPTVAASYAIIFGLPLFYLTLYCGREYANVIHLPEPAQELPLRRRVALRLPKVLRVWIQSRQAGGKADQLLFLFLFMALPLILHGWLFADFVDGVVWHRREKAEFTSGWRENFSQFVPLAEAFLDDNFRIGDMKSETKNLITNVSYYPFWEPWGLLLAEILALGLCLDLLWTLVRTAPPKPEDSS